MLVGKSVFGPNEGGGSGNGSRPIFCGYSPRGVSVSSPIKDYWKNGLSEDPKIRIMDVIDSLAARRRVLDTIRAQVHAARKWRNKLVHEGDSEATQVELTDARRSFGKFLGFLPDDW